MKRVLLTGASGFIGRHCIPFLLENDYEVHAVFHTKDIDKSFNNINNNKDVNKDNLIWHRCNLLDQKEQKKLFIDIQPTHLLHLAWYTTYKEYWTSIENFRWVQTSLDLMINFGENGGKRAVLAGTCAEYDWKYGYCSEYITPLRPSTIYGTCKNSFHEMASQYSEKVGISFAWGRIFYLYGPFENKSRFIPHIINSLLLDQRTYYRNQIRDFLYVKDTASAFISLLDSNVQGTINIASGQPVSMKHIAYKIADNIKKQDLIQFIGLKTLEDEPFILLANTNRLNQEVRWFPRYSLDEGLRETIEWWKN